MSNEPRTAEEAITGGNTATGWSGIRSWVILAKVVPVAAMVGGLGWYLTHPIVPGNAAAAAGTMQGKVASVDPEDLAAHPAARMTVPPVTRTARPHLEVADFAATPVPVRPATAAAAPVDPPAAPVAPTSPPTLSPAAIAAQKRAEEDRAALDAPLVVAPAPTPGAQTPAQRVASTVRSNASDYDVSPPSDTFLAPGTEIDVTLYTSIDSTVPGMITGFVGRDVLDFYKRVTVIPARSKVVGHMVTTALQPGENRIGVVWEGILLPNGHMIALDGAPGIDLTGTAGFGATIDNHTRKEIVNVIAFSILAAGAQLAQPRNDGCTSNGFGCTPSVGQAIGQAVGTQIANLSTAAYNRSTQIPPTAHVVEGAQVGVEITNYLPMRPWDPTAQ